MYMYMCVYIYIYIYIYIQVGLSRLCARVAPSRAISLSPASATIAGGSPGSRLYHYYCYYYYCYYYCYCCYYYYYYYYYCCYLDFAKASLASARPRDTGQPPSQGNNNKCVLLT